MVRNPPATVIILAKLTLMLSVSPEPRAAPAVGRGTRSTGLSCLIGSRLPVHSSQFLGLTEEDLNKYDLTQGAKKKLKTQLELQKSFGCVAKKECKE